VKNLKKAKCCVNCEYVYEGHDNIFICNYEDKYLNAWQLYRSLGIRDPQWIEASEGLAEFEEENNVLDDICDNYKSKE
jgi:hypothetical protein